MCIYAGYARWVSLRAKNYPSVVNTAGTTFSTGEYSHSFSIGEILITTIPGGDNQVTQGYLQPESLPAPDGFDYFPNPIDDRLFLVRAEKVKAVRIYDIAGRLVFEGAYDGKAIVVDQLSGGTYLMNTLNADNKILHKFTIIKQ